jgi:hypothetical protein
MLTSAGAAAAPNRILLFPDAGVTCSRPAVTQTVSSPAALMRGGPGSQAVLPSIALYFPSGVAVDGRGNLYFADDVNNRIRVLYGAGAPPPQTPEAPLGAGLTLVAAVLAMGLRRRGASRTRRDAGGIASGPQAAPPG